jgi:hypothetical protein
MPDTQNAPETPGQPPEAESLVEAGNASETSWLAALRPLLPTVLTCALVTTVLLAGYHFLVVRSAGAAANKFATVDIGELVRIKQLQTTLAMLQPGVTDKERGAVYDQITAFGQQLDGTVKKIQADCNCVLLVRGAVVGGLPDYTENAKALVGLQGLDPEKLSQQIVALNAPGGQPPGAAAMEGGKLRDPAPAARQSGR